MAAERITEIIEITPEIIAALNAERTRTGLGVQAILRGTRKSRPEGISVGRVNGWLNGTTTTAEMEHVAYVQQRWASFPDKEAQWVVLTDNNRKLLRRKIKETGLSAYKLFSKRDDLPQNFNPKHIYNYYAVHRSKIEKSYFDYILKVARAHKGKGYISIPEQFLRQLKLEIRRTGIPPNTLINTLKKKKVDVPVNAFTINAWLRGTIKLADRTEMNWVLEQYAALSDKQIIKPVATPISRYADSSPIASPDLKKMLLYREILGILPGKVFENATNIPQGLNKHMVSSWLSEITKNANPNHVKWVLERCRDLVKQAMVIDNQ